MHDIETLIHHFLGVSWGPVIPPGEAMAVIEATKGNNGYYLISDGGNGSYRTRIRTPSFPHMQMLPTVVPGSHDSGFAGDTRKPGLRSGRYRPVRGKENRKAMLTVEERQEIDDELAAVPDQAGHVHRMRC